MDEVEKLKEMNKNLAEINDHLRNQLITQYHWISQLLEMISTLVKRSKDD